MSLLKINGVAIPDPSDFRVGVMDISKAERNANGRMVIDIITTKVKLEMSWKYLTAEELSSILTSISPSTFNVNYLDPRTNTRQTRLFYVGDRQAGLYRFIDGKPTWVDIGFNFIEV